MKKFFILIVFIAFTNIASSQKDSASRIKLHSISIEMHSNNYLTNYWRASKEDFLRFENTDAILLSSPSGSTTGYGPSYQYTYNGLFSGKLFFNLPKLKNLQLYCGLNFGFQRILTLGHLVNHYDTVDIFTSSYSNKKVYTVINTQQSFFFDLSSKKIHISIGVQFITNSKKRLWLSAGLELNPGLTFDNTYRSGRSLSVYTLTLNEQSKYDNISSYSRDYSSNRLQNIEKAYRKINGLGFIGSINLPVSINLRLSKNIQLLNKICFFAQLSPGGFLVYNRFNNKQFGLNINGALGIRYCL